MDPAAPSLPVERRGLFRVSATAFAANRTFSPLPQPYRTIMKKLLVGVLTLWGMLLALPAAAQASLGTQTAVTSTDSPGETVFLTLYIRDGGCYRATFDTDDHPVGGLSTKALNEKFDAVCSLARILNFMRQNGYRVVTFAPKPEPLYNGTMSRPREHLIVFEYIKPQ